MESIRVMYVGSKPMKEDNIAATGVVWLGEGDVQEVPLSAWPKLAPHTGVWRLADDVTRAPASAPAPTPAAAPVAAPAPTPAPVAAPAQPEAPAGIYGTNHPAHIDIGGEQVQLGELVRAAHATSGLTDQDWNELPEQDRHDFVEAEIEARRTAAADAKVMAAAKTADAAPLSRDELKAALLALGVEFRGNASTATLVELHAQATAGKKEG